MKPNVQHDHHIKILFVCLGNICRSPMAETVFNHKIQQSALSHRFSGSSAGTADYHIGEPPHHGTQKKLTENGVDFSYSFAAQLKKSDSLHYDYIIAMDESNLRNIRRQVQKNEDCKICLLSDFRNPENHWTEVPDPWYTGNFDQTYALVEEACENLIAHLQNELG